MSNINRELCDCICSGRSLDRMLRPAILTILQDHACALHGYAIEKELRVFRFFEQQPPDFAGLYRLLKRMEGEGLLVSQRGDSHVGPSKRVYRLTGRGRRCLSRWLDSLVEYREMLEDLIAHVKSTVEGGV